MLPWLDALLQRAGPGALPLIALAAALEYLFPPFPGDAVTMLGGFYAVRAGVPIPWVLLAVMVGSLGGASADYAIGRYAGPRLERLRGGTWRLFALTPERLALWEERFRRRAPYWLAINRFLPGVRAPIFLAAGLSRVPFSKVILFGGLSTLLWNVGLMAVGVLLGAEAERLLELVERWGRMWLVLFGVVAVAALLFFGARALSRRRRTRM